MNKNVIMKDARNMSFFPSFCRLSLVVRFFIQLNAIIVLLFPSIIIIICSNSDLVHIYWLGWLTVKCQLLVIIRRNHDKVWIKWVLWFECYKRCAVANEAPACPTYLLDDFHVQTTEQLRRLIGRIVKLWNVVVMFSSSATSFNSTISCVKTSSSRPSTSSDVKRMFGKTLNQKREEDFSATLIEGCRETVSTQLLVREKDRDNWWWQKTTATTVGEKKWGRLIDLETNTCCQKKSITLSPFLLCIGRRCHHRRCPMQSPDARRWSVFIYV